MVRTLFDYGENRLDYGALLMPDIGFTVDFAVSLTYSLDLEALLGVPISLGLLDADMGTELIDNPLFILEAIRKSSDKIAIFCNAGSIALPRSIRSVFALLENSVFEVDLRGRGNSYPSFHPKLWFIKYTNDTGDSYIKLIVLSRNLTFDRSFDYAVAMTGQIGKNVLAKNKPLSDMLQFVAEYANPQKRKRIRSLADDMMLIESFNIGDTADDRFDDYEFFPLGISPYSAESTGLFDIHQDMIVFSPFISESMACRLAEITRHKKTLFTRKGALHQNIIEKYDDVYITKDIFLDNEALAEGNDALIGSDIHAKLYFTQDNSGNSLYIGSANASDKAFHENVEFLLKLKFRKRWVSYKGMLDEFLPAEGCPFERISAITADDQTGDTSHLDKAIRAALRTIKNACVIAEGDRYSITIHTNDRELDKTVSIAPIFKQDSFHPLHNGLVFPDMLLKELSAFFIAKIEDKQAIVKINMLGMPEGRDQAIYTSIIKDKNGLLAYVSLMLSDNYAGEFFAQHELTRLLAGKEEQSASIPAALYERMLTCLARNPGRLLELDSLKDRLDAELQMETKEFWETFYPPFKEIAIGMKKAKEKEKAKIK